MFYIGKLGKKAKIACFRDLNHLNFVFCANFVPYHMRLNARNFLAIFGTLKFSSSGKGGPEKSLGNGDFGPFSPKMT